MAAQQEKRTKTTKRHNRGLWNSRQCHKLRIGLLRSLIKGLSLYFMLRSLIKGLSLYFKSLANRGCLGEPEIRDFRVAERFHPVTEGK